MEKKPTYHDLIKEINGKLGEVNHKQVCFIYNYLFEKNLKPIPSDVVERIEVSVKNGSEGPKHDPYSFTEFYCVARNGVEFFLHIGLAEYLTINGKASLEGYHYRYSFNSETDTWEQVALENEGSGITIGQIFEDACERKLCDIYQEKQDEYEEDPFGCLSDYE